MTAVRVDSKGRLTIPKAARDRLRVKTGDTFFVEEDGHVLRYAKATNPFDVLAEDATKEYRAGHTRSLREMTTHESHE